MSTVDEVSADGAAAGKPLRADARRNRERLMAAAQAAFTENGEAASMDDIAKRAGVGPGTLYRHFPSREALLAEVYREGIAGLAARAVELGATEPPMTALVTFLREQVEYGRSKRGLGVAVKAMINESETMDWCRETLRTAVGDLLDRAKADGSVRPDADRLVVLRLVHAVAYASENAPEMSDRMLDVVIDGLRP
ncbi:TetR/AcrR family transcriptional regulator [Hamadaea tsunoensis]|uniref:TetR/AcrR family transcriptional regulator n=1 Tax=Hamadaea tsunoensis TaxID=53368 RepID=UPI00041089F4|nr:TetR/AcrR family transcriptional regulator [Hamadaea tsunoensis]